MEFVTGTDGEVLKMNNNLSFLKSPLERLAAIPGDGEPYICRGKR